MIKKLSRCQSRYLVVLLLVCLSFSLTGCSNKDKEEDKNDALTPGAQMISNSDVPEDRYDATKNPRTGANAETPLVIATSTLDGKFSPFFATSAYDVAIEGMTQLPLLTIDKAGIPIAGVDENCLAFAYDQKVSGTDEDKISEYTFILKRGITFSDGREVTVKDVLFSMYVLCDPRYDGSSTFYSLAIEGLEEYRSQEEGVSGIAGITSGTMECEDGIKRDYIKVRISGIDPTAIFKLGIEIAPFHYYTEGYDGKLNAYGVEVDTKEFMDHLKTKNAAPMGAGPYRFVSFKDNVVSFIANDRFCLGSPKIANLRYQVVASGSELDAVLTNTVFFSEPAASTTIINSITTGGGDYEKLSYLLVDNDGYGYIGINAQAVPDFSLRRAIAHSLNVELCVEDYFGELASVNYRTMTKVGWAYPENPESMFPFDETGETSRSLLAEAGYRYDEKNNILYYPDNSDNKGKQVSLTFTLPFSANDHPAGSVFLESQRILEAMGFKTEIVVDDQVLNKLATAYESGIQIWCGAWGSGGSDPDMYQIWYSDPDKNQSTSPNGTGLYWLYNNGSETEKSMLRRLNEYILAGRQTLDTEERKAIYAKALELSTGLAVEIPTYQRKNMYVYNKRVIQADTLLAGTEVTPFQSPISKIWEVELH